MIIKIFSTLLISSLIFAQATSQEIKPAAKPATQKEKSPLKIQADHMKYDETGSIIYFTGNIKVDDGQMKVNSDLMTVKLDKENNPSLIVCEKNVVIRKENSTSYSDRAEYFVADEKVVLTGNPRVERVNSKGEKEEMSGKEIIFYKNTNVIESTGVGIEFNGNNSDKNKPKTENK